MKVRLSDNSITRGAVVDDAFDVGVAEQGYDPAGSEDDAFGEFAQPGEGLFTDEDGHQRAGTQSVGGRVVGAGRHLDQGRGAALPAGAQ